jgi:hypothetical protein
VELGESTDGWTDGESAGFDWRGGEIASLLAGLAGAADASTGALAGLRDGGGAGFSPLTTEAKDSLFTARGDGVDSDRMDGKGVGLVASLGGEATWRRLFEAEDETPTETIDFLVGEGGVSLEGIAVEDEPLENLDFLTIVDLEKADALASLEAAAFFSSVTIAPGLGLRRERVDCTFFLEDEGVEPTAKTGDGILDMMAVRMRAER